MKKLIVLAAALSIGVSGWAQKKNVSTAQAALTREDYTKAKSAIDEAVEDPTTKDDPKTWFTRGEIYTVLQGQQAFQSSNPLLEASKSYLKVVELDPGYKKSEMDARLLTASQVFYNQGLENYQAQKYKDAYEAFSLPITVSKLDGGKRFSSVKAFDTIVAYAYLQRAFSSYFGEDYGRAIPDLQIAKESPVTRDASVFLVLIDIYQKQDKEAEASALITEGRKVYPDNTELRNAELNLYLKSGNQDALLKKLEEAVAKDPNNPELLFNLGNGYNNLAFPKDATGKDLPKPANYAELIGKAEDAYTKAIAADKENKSEYSYNLGALYFNQASGIINEMNGLGTSAADQKKYDDLAVRRDAMFGKALPHLEKVYTSLDAKLSKLNQDDKVTYQSVIFALREVYAKQNKMDKVTEMKNKLDAFKAAEK